MYDMYHCDKRRIAIVNGSTISILIQGVGWNSQSYIEMCTCSLCRQPCTVAESCLGLDTHGATWTLIYYSEYSLIRHNWLGPHFGGLI